MEQMNLSSVDQITTIQLELNSSCNLLCNSCLKPYYIGQWQETDMDSTLFHRVITELPPRTNIHLQGWGEPLLHPKLFSYIKQLKEEDFTVSFTTNGTIMTSELAQDILRSGLDGITFSMAGSCPQTQDALRGKGTFQRLLETLNIFDREKKACLHHTPKTAVSYLVTPETVDELPKAISLCSKAGIDTFVTVHLSQAGSRQQHKYHFSLTDEYNRNHLMTRIRSHTQALFSPIGLQLHPFSPGLAPICDKNPLHSLFISARGDVSPCVFLCPPVSDSIHWHYHGTETERKPVHFGNIKTRSLEEIWNSTEYTAFRETYRRRRDFHDEQLSQVKYSMEGAKQLEQARDNIQSFFETHPPPEVCRSCYKTEGF